MFETLNFCNYIVIVFTYICMYTLVLFLSAIDAVNINIIFVSGFERISIIYNVI